MSWLTKAAAGIAVSLALTGTAFAQSQAAIASRLNDEGKELMYANNYSAASGKFREAVARVPEAKYFFNLCTSLFQEGKFGEALTACAAVDKNSPSPDLQAKATKLVGRIKDEAKAQKIDVEPEGGGGLVDCNANPNSPGCAPPPATCQTDPSLPECNQPVRNNQPPPPAIGRAPTGPGVFAAITPDNKYIWTLGVDVFGGGGTIGDDLGNYGSAAGGVRFKSDFLFMPRARVGAQGYVQYQRFVPGEEQAGRANNLDIVDIGGAIYKHLCPPNTERLCLTPLLGAHLALMSPGFDQFGDTKEFNYAAAGARAEIGLQFALGLRMEHVLSVTLGANVYSPVFSGPSPQDVTDAGLDTGGVVGYIGFGYTHRFSTPLGQRAFITLE